MKKRIIKYKVLSCTEQCREDMRISSLLPAIVVFTLSLIAVPLNLPENYWVDFLAWGFDRFGMTGLVSVISFLTAWVAFGLYFRKGCSACGEAIKESERIESKIRWFGYF